LKSLTVILALLNDRNTEIEDYFNENNSILKEIYENGSRSVKSEAKKVMKLCLDASDLSELLSSSQDRVQKGNPLQIQAQSIQSASSTSLLTQDASPTQQLFATQASSVAQQTSIFSDFESGSGVAETSEMFSGLELNPSSSQANPQQEPSKSAFDFMSEAQSHTGVVSASSDGFDLLDDVFSAPPPQVQQEAVKVKSRDPLGDLMAAHDGQHGTSSKQKPRPHIQSTTIAPSATVLSTPQPMPFNKSSFNASTPEDPFRGLEASGANSTTYGNQKKSGFDFLNQDSGPAKPVQPKKEAFAFVDGLFGKE